MATYTRDQFVRAVLQEIGVQDANSAPSAADSVLANDRAQQVFETLSHDGLIPFDLDSDTIPAPYFLALVQVVAPHLAVPFGIASRAEMLEVRGQMAMRTLRRLKAQPHFGTVAPAAYY